MQNEGKRQLLLVDYTINLYMLNHMFKVFFVTPAQSFPEKQRCHTLLIMSVSEKCGKSGTIKSKRNETKLQHFPRMSDFLDVVREFNCIFPVYRFVVIMGLVLSKTILLIFNAIFYFTLNNGCIECFLRNRFN